MAFSIFGIENLALGEFKVGMILLCLLFFYDIFWVFYTPVMVSVAKNIEGPVKLMFPKLKEAIELMRKEKGEDITFLRGVHLREDVRKFVNIPIKEQLIWEWLWSVREES